MKAAKDADLGFNAATETYENLVKAGVIDPVKVVRTALSERLIHRVAAAHHRSAGLRIPEKAKPEAGHSHGPGMDDY